LRACLQSCQGLSVRTQDGIQLVHGHIAALLGGLDHLLDSIIGKVEKRPVRHAFAFGFAFFFFFRFGCHAMVSVKGLGASGLRRAGVPQIALFALMCD
jgi:hypothetical protein